MSLYDELKRRNVLRVAAGYIVTSWLVIQVVETIFPAFGFGDAAIRVVVIFFAAAFVPVLILTWVFEWTPQGFRKDSAVDHAQPARASAQRAFDRVVMVILALAVGLFAFDKFVLDPARDAERFETAREEGRTEAVTKAYGDKSIAVIPFINLSSDPEQAFFADGVAEEVLNLLARIPELRVISRSSSFSFRGDELEIPEIAKRLNVAHILEGSVRKAGNRIRITAQLIEANSDTHLWSETFDRNLDDIFAIQDEIAAHIVEKLRVEIVGPMPIATRTDPVALALTVQARQIFYDSFLGDFDEPFGDRMAALLDKALEIDPDYAPAMAWYAYANWLRRGEGLITLDEENRLFDELAARTLAIDPEQATILQLQAWTETFVNVDIEKAAGLYERALRSAPNDSEMLRQVGRFAYIVERYDESLVLLERAVSLDPLCTTCLYFLSRGYMIAGRLQEAEEARERFLLIGGGGGYFFYGVIKLLQGDAEAALRIFDDHLKDNEYQYPHASAMAFHSLGRHEESDAMLATLIENWGDEVPDAVAQVFAWRGEKDSAFEWLDLALDTDQSAEIQGTSRVARLGDPVFQNLHDDPRWEDFRRRTGLPSERIAAIEIDLKIPGN
jgi:TolB-like protein/tetratricopeptide (TPR) repeat protein